VDVVCVDSVEVAVCGVDDVEEPVLVECGVDEELELDEDDIARAVEPKPPRTIVPFAGALNPAP